MLIKRWLKIAGAIFLSFLFIIPVLSQTYPRTIELDRGRLWHSFHFTQECEPLADWEPMNYGLDWPGYNIKELSSNIGGTYTHMITGGFFISALRTIDPDTVQGWMDFCVNGDRNTSWDKGKKPFLALRHEKKWKKGENYFLATDPNEAEELIISEWEKDPQYPDYDKENKKFNIHVTREVRQWSGSQADQNYVIVEYTIQSVRTELHGLDSAVVLFSYGISPTDRGWNYTNPNYPPGARNTQSRWHSEDDLVTFWAGDFQETSQDESFDYYEYYERNTVTNEIEKHHEFMAPGKVGLKILDVTLNDQPLDYEFTWSAGPQSSDYEGPFTGVSGFDNKYNAMKNPENLREAFTDPNDPRMGNSRLYANFSIGPFNLRGRGRGELKVAVAEFVGGADLKTARSLTLEEKDSVEALADSAINYLNDRVEFNYNHDYTVPMPTPAPQFSVTPDSSREGRVGNIISFADSVEKINDPHQGSPDLAGYRIYRSAEYPFGPWKMIADIPIKSDQYWNEELGEYQFLDKEVALGYGYYYSVTSYDHGHDQWAIDPSVEVPSLESSIFANRSSEPFYTTLRPQTGKDAISNVTVVPNPFYVSSGLQSSADAKMIQFVNVPEKCTIRIFTLRGDLVKTIHHNDPTSGVTTWNQISDSNQYIKSGMYFYHLKSEFGETSGKFCIIN
ncbi:MAG TPA: hypothetical protein VKP78_01685 [bacterium]|nr:hypothetical protein [bacterium]